ncbi:hypothetical protein PUR49_39935 [Streptomyces sp. BE147]|uniref:hypothetical protein n=1 Tax=Streptomyces sp. BE147 TaxID=3002524 RepID=UPI002E76DB68|nr:hypothetical protein [Streptomyces sp. BE147]MEE1742656.1 hypothetical protein [Streptomyces sp. BE147]
MRTHQLRLDSPLPLSHGDELAKRIYYASSDIESFRLIEKEQCVVAVEVTTADEVETVDLARKVNLINDRDVLPQRITHTERVWSSPHSERFADGDVYDQLLALGLVHEMGQGLIASSGLFTATLHALDERIRSLAVGRFGAREQLYPTLISTETLQRGGYLDSFPQFLMSAHRLHADVDTYSEFVVGEEGAEDVGARLARHGEHSGYCLPPTMCFHTYQQFHGEELGSGGTAVTSRGKSFRHESRYSRSVERLWDFTIREMVFFGEGKEVADLRQSFLEASCELIDELGLPGHVEGANDPFFGDGRNPRRMLAQRLSGLKYELRLPVAAGRTVSVASFNAHGTLFGEAFKITLAGGTTASSACVGFGLERFAYSFFCQYGPELGDWPASVRRSLGL